MSAHACTEHHVERLTHKGVNHAEEQKEKLMELKSELRKVTLHLEVATINIALCVPTAALLSFRPEAAEALGSAFPVILTLVVANLLISINSLLDQGPIWYMLKGDINQIKKPE